MTLYIIIHKMFKCSPMQSRQSKSISIAQCTTVYSVSHMDSKSPSHTFYAGQIETSATTRCFLVNGTIGVFMPELVIVLIAEQIQVMPSSCNDEFAYFEAS